MPFDTFISYNSNDGRVVESLRDHLVRRNFTAWLDKYELRPGLRYQPQLQQALSESSSVLVCIGANGAGPWQTEEIEVALTRSTGQSNSRSASRQLPVIPVLLPGCPQAPEISVFLEQRHWVDLREGIDETGVDQLVFGITGERPARLASPRTDLPRPVESALPPVGGTVSTTSPLYVERPSDDLAKRLLAQVESITLAIRGPRQIGKSSLLARAAACAQEAGKQVVYIDFQRDFDQEDLEDADRFYPLFMSLIAESLELEDLTDDPKVWSAKRANNRNATRYLSKQILAEVDGPILLAMDEVDRVYNAPFSSDLFGLLRSWHNDRAMKPDMARLGIILVMSTEPQALIDDPNQSPFNVATPLPLQDFNAEQLQRLNALHGNCLNDAEFEQLQELVGGHPYLVRAALYVVATGQYGPGELFANALRTDDKGPFASHLSHFERVLSRNADLADAMSLVIQGHKRLDADSHYRLLGLGLTRETADGAAPRNALYRRFFTERLSA